MQQGPCVSEGGGERDVELGTGGGGGSGRALAEDEVEEGKHRAALKCALLLRAQAGDAVRRRIQPHGVRPDLRREVARTLVQRSRVRRQAGPRANQHLLREQSQTQQAVGVRGSGQRGERTQQRAGRRSARLRTFVPSGTRSSARRTSRSSIASVR